jgi:hypothetical protein
MFYALVYSTTAYRGNNCYYYNGMLFFVTYELTLISIRAVTPLQMAAVHNSADAMLHMMHSIQMLHISGGIE